MFNVIKEKTDWLLTYDKSNRTDAKDGVVIVRHATLRSRFIPIAFNTQKQARACAVALNKKYWKAFKSGGENISQLGTVADEMVKLIESHLG